MSLVKKNMEDYTESYNTLLDTIDETAKKSSKLINMAVEYQHLMKSKTQAERSALATKIKESYRNIVPLVTKIQETNQNYLINAVKMFNKLETDFEKRFVFSGKLEKISKVKYLTDTIKFIDRSPQNPDSWPQDNDPVGQINGLEKNITHLHDAADKFFNDLMDFHHNNVFVRIARTKGVILQSLNRGEMTNASTLSILSGGSPSLESNTAESKVELTVKENNPADDTWTNVRTKERGNPSSYAQNPKSHNKQDNSQANPKDGWEDLVEQPSNIKKP